MAGEWIAPAQSTISRPAISSPAVVARQHADRPPAVETDALDERLTPDRHIRAATGGFQVAVVGRDARAGEAIDGEGETPVLSGALWSSAHG